MRDPYIEKEPSLWGGKLEWAVGGVVGIAILTLTLTMCDGDTELSLKIGHTYSISDGPLLGCRTRETTERV